MYSLYDGLEMENRIDNYYSLYHNCTNKLEEIEHRYNRMSSVLVYFQQEYLDCDIPTYFLHQCIQYFDTIMHS